MEEGDWAEADETLARTWSNLARGVRSIVREIEQVQKRLHSITIVQFEALNLIYDSPEGYVRPSDISAWVRYSSGSTTKLVDRLVALGFVERSQSGNGNRAVRLSLSPRGRELTRSARETHRRVALPLLAEAIPEQDRALLLELTRHLIGLRGIEEGLGGRP